MAKFLFSLMGFVFVIQISGVVYVSVQYMNRFNQAITERQMTREEALQSLGPLAFESFMHHMLFIGPIFICVGAILFYTAPFRSLITILLLSILNR